MQYDTIILELLSRIKKLEEDVEELKQTASSTNFIPSFDGEETSDEVEWQLNSRRGTYKKMTNEMIDICYEYGKKLVSGSNAMELAEEIAELTGMNRNSAIMYLYAVQGMLEGTIYKRAINNNAIKRYYDIILSEYGVEGLKKAIRATRLYIDYRRECGISSDSIEEICDRYESSL